MKKTEKRIKIFSMIMQIIMQIFLMLPWMNLGAERSNVPWYVVRWITSGNGMSYITETVGNIKRAGSADAGAGADAIYC